VAIEDSRHRVFGVHPLSNEIHSSRNVLIQPVGKVGGKVVAEGSGHAGVGGIGLGSNRVKEDIASLAGIGLEVVKLTLALNGVHVSVNGLIKVHEVDISEQECRRQCDSSSFGSGVEGSNEAIIIELVPSIVIGGSTSEQEISSADVLVNISDTVDGTKDGRHGQENEKGSTHLETSR